MDSTSSPVIPEETCFQDGSAHDARQELVSKKHTMKYTGGGIRMLCSREVYELLRENVDYYYSLLEVRRHGFPTKPGMKVA